MASRKRPGARRRRDEDEPAKPRPKPLPLTIDSPGPHTWQDLECMRYVHFCPCNGCHKGQSFAHWIYLGSHLFTFCDECCPVCKPVETLQARDFEAKCELLSGLWTKYPALDDVLDLTDPQAVLVERVLRR